MAFYEVKKSYFTNEYDMQYQTPSRSIEYT
jgi:hypothetical protein